MWRLSDEFVNAPQIVGNDEQYAATMALIANEIGVPARVVLGAEVPEGGGRDRQGRLGLGRAAGRGRLVADAADRAFMSDQPPADQLPETNTPMSGHRVPPPAPIPPPSDAGEQSDADLKERKATRKKKEEAEDEGLIPGAPRLAGRRRDVRRWPAAAPRPPRWAPSSASRLLRRHRRRSAASPSARFVGAWRELVDHARDLGQAVPLGPTVTRREQSGGIVSDQAPSLARRADSFVFGPSAPETAAAATYWESVDAERRAMSHWRGSPSAAAGRDQPPVAAAAVGPRPLRWTSRRRRLPRPPRRPLGRGGSPGCVAA